MDTGTIVPTKSDRDVIFILQLLNQALTLHSAWASVNQ